MTLLSAFFNHSLSNSTLYFEPIDSIACSAASNAWNIPITWVADIESAEVLNSSLPELDVSDSTTKLEELLNKVEGV